MSKRKPNSFRPTVTPLEDRVIPSVSSITAASGVLTVKCTNNATIVLVSQTPTSITIRDQVAGKSWSYSPSNYSGVVVDAGSGSDTFTASATNPNSARRVTFVGGSGTDVFTGLSGPVSMKGGSGSDTLIATAGNDTLVGGSGTDYIQGGSGNCLLEAGTGNDYLNGGMGIATIVGGIGNDTIVAMNGQADDTIYTGIGQEVLWVDEVNGVTDFIIGSTANATIQAVSGFANPGPTNVLNGGTFKEPKLLPDTFYEPFTNRPLFSTNGPTVADVNQYINPMGGGVNGTGTTLDDSWLLAGLAAIAEQDPQAIEQNVVYFGDNTYGVKLGDSYYRVDDQLPVNTYGSTTTAYALTGVQNSMWVPIVEKAFAYYGSPVNAPNFINLVAVNGGVTDDVYLAFGANPDTVGSIPFNGPGGFANATELGQAFQLLMNAGYSTCAGLTAAVTGTDVDTGLAVNLVANREYTVTSVSIGFNGQVTGVVLRDPSGANPDGVYVTLAKLYAATGTIDFGLV